MTANALLSFLFPYAVTEGFTNLLKTPCISAGFKPEKSFPPEKRKYTLRSQGMDFIPSSIELTGMGNILINTMSREQSYQGRR